MDYRRTKSWALPGLPPVINAMGRATILGGSTLSGSSLEALVAANDWYVDMKALLQKSGEMIAPLLGAEGAIITAGSTSAIHLGTAAVMTGTDVQKIERLPNTEGMRNEVVSFRRAALPEFGYRYWKCFADIGAEIMWAGGAASGTIPDMESRINSKTALLVAAPGVFARAGLPSVEDVISLGKRHGVPVFVDAAGNTFPLEEMTRYALAGADLVTYGGKYFNGPQATGILCGRKDLIDAALLHSFIGWQYGTMGVGRAMKIDRQAIAAMIVALQEWLAMDHGVRLASEDAKVRCIAQALEGIPGVRITRCGTSMVGVGRPVEGTDELAGSLLIELDSGFTAKDASRVAAELQEGDPSIWVLASREGLATVTTTQSGTIGMTMSCVNDGHELIIADRLREILLSGS